MECQGDSFSMIIDLDDSISLYNSSTYASGEQMQLTSGDYRFGSLYAIDLREVHIIGVSGTWSDRIHSIRVRRYSSGGIM